MISHLKIRNYALIKELEIGFDPGYITITGETGAGKSILMGALALILGQRADTSVLLKKDEKCIVEGQFTIGNQHTPFFEEHDLDFDPETLLRREILPGGKSRAFINDTPVTLSVLKSLGDQLVDIHSQHQSLHLKDHLYQLSVIDHVGRLNETLKGYQELYYRYSASRAELARQREAIEKISGELDYYQFQYDELTAAELKADEMEALEQDAAALEHAEEIKYALTVTGEALSGEGQVLQMLNEGLQVLKKSGKIHAPSAAFFGRIESSYIELKDAADEMHSAAEKIAHDPERLNQVKERIDLIYSLLQKHRKQDVGELIALREALNEKITAITFSDEHLKKLGEETGLMLKELHARAGELHASREKAGKYVEKKIVTQLRELGIPHADFRVRVERTEEPGRHGMDDVRFLFSANRQAPAEEISRVASGGEVSRLMLSIKSLLSDFKGLPTLIFDEIDAGVSGEIAEKMGSIMKRMSGGRQVIAITHLPQVASQGNEHFLVYKEQETHANVTHIRKLTKEERITEIAKLLSGEKLTAAAISNARELLNLAG